jgi:hypothetical protein
MQDYNQVGETRSTATAALSKNMAGRVAIRTNSAREKAGPYDETNRGHVRF